MNDQQAEVMLLAMFFLAVWSLAVGVVRLTSALADSDRGPQADREAIFLSKWKEGGGR